MRGEVRRHFHDELQGVEISVQEMGRAAVAMVERTMQAVTGHDAALFDEVVAADDEVDRYYFQTERQILDLFALQTPVASDLRLLTALLHITLHLERVADMAVNVAKMGKLAWGLPRSSRVVQYLEEMGSVSSQMVAAAMDALARRDLDLCHRLPAMDEPVDRLNRGMLEHVLEMSHDPALLEWGIRMHVVSRQLERVGDHAVDIGEQVAFLITGEFREFTDASHPEVESRARQ